MILSIDRYNGSGTTVVFLFPMKLHLNVAGHINLVQSVSPQGIVITDRLYTASVLLTASEIRPDWQPQRVADLTAEDFHPVVEYQPEVVLLGTGARLAFPHPRVTEPLINRAIGLEVMDTRAACRTFNILAGDGRKVVAALLPVNE